MNSDHAAQVPGFRLPSRSVGSRLVASLVAASLVLLAAASLVWFFGWDRSTPDVTAYWSAATAFLDGRALYAPPPPGISPKAYLYPPLFAVLFSPLTLLPPLWGYAVWMALHGLFLVALVRTAAALAAVESEQARVRYLALLLVWLPPAVGGDFQEGQVNLLVTSMVAGALLLVERGRPIRGGALLALAAHVKLLPAALLIPWLVQGRRRAVAAAVLAMAVFVLLPAVVTVPRDGLVPGLGAAVSLHVDFVRTVVAPAAADATVVGDEQFYVLNNSLVAVLHRVFGDGVAFSPFPALSSWHGPLLFPLPRLLLRGAALLGGLCLFGAALLLARRTSASRRGRAASLALALAAVELTFLNCWEHHLVFLVLVLAPVSALGGRGTAAWRAILALSAVVFLLWTGPYLLAPVALAGGREWVGSMLATVRAWGFPTMAVVLLGALTCVAQGMGRADTVPTPASPPR